MDQLKTAASDLGISNEVEPQVTVTSPSFVGIDEVKAHLKTQIQDVGFVEKIVRTEQSLVVEGWAADPAARSPAVAVHVFVAGEDVAVDTPNLPRPDVATALNTPDVPHIPAAGFTPQEELQLFDYRAALRFFQEFPLQSSEFTIVLPGADAAVGRAPIRPTAPRQRTSIDEGRRPVQQ